MTFLNYFEKFIFLISSSLILLYGFWTGLSITTYFLSLGRFTVTISILDAASKVLAFTAFITLTSSLYVKRVYSRKPMPKNNDYGSLLAIIPIYNDSEVLKNSVKSLKSSNYKYLDILVVCEEEDTKSINKAKELNCEVQLNQYPGSKAGAINTAFEETNYDLYGIFDADQIVEPDFIPCAVAKIEQGYDGFEARKMPIIEGVVESFAYCERVLTRIAYSFTELSGFKTLGSSSVIMRSEVLEETGGYDTKMVTEDVDFHHRVFRAGFNVERDHRCVTMMKSPHTWSDLWMQRKRWRIGWSQVLHRTLTGGYTNYLSYRGIISTLRVLIGFAAALSLLFLSAKYILLLIFDVELVYTLPLLVIYTAVGLVSWKDYREKRNKFLGRKLILAPLIIPVSGLIALKSLLEYILTWNGEWYRIDK